ncbi:MAG: gamma carbonic anhydrase family protein [Acidobacteria bacterium]|nr:gamma carbonic anhydrase family protein [Acidobacteriota bacterium]MCI0567503.1 gamma carbonic anhydrase family protein [Acidobacteriota bacterium]
MAQQRFLPTRLNIHPSAFVAENCTLRGEVQVGAQSSLWFQCVLRGDTAPIRIGERSNIQDGCILHTDLDVPVEIGNDVTVGHGAIVHGAHVGAETLIAMRATVLSHAVIGRHCLVGAGALVPERMVVPDGSLVLGVPGRIVRPLTAQEIERVLENARVYLAYAQAYTEGLVGRPSGESS